MRTLALCSFFLVLFLGNTAFSQTNDTAQTPPVSPPNPSTPPAPPTAPSETAPTPPATPPPPPAPEHHAQLQQAPGLVPLRVRSTRASMPIGLVIPSPDGGEPTRRDLCSTPCELWVRPGSFALSAGGAPFRWTIADLQVPSSGLGVLLRTGYTAPYSAGFATLVVGAAFMLAGPILWGAAPALQTSTSPMPLPGAVEMWAAGGALLGVGVVGLSVGLGLMLANPVGIAAEEPLWRTPEN